VEQLSVAVEPVRGSRLPRDFSDSVRALRTAAEAGDPTAEFLLGHAYESGLGVTKDVTETARWYGRAVVPQPPTTPGTAAATPMNFAQAFELYRRAAEAGNGQAELYMGLEYDMGTDVPRNVEKAATWYRKAAAQGSASAENNLGVLYHEGDGLPKDGMEAVNWFSRAAARGSATAEYCLGRMYFEGDGVRQDDAQAAEWFQKAATRGSSSAQVMMSWMYATGRGVPGSTSTAYMWINLAAAKEDQARATRQQLEQIISKPELAEGQKETHDWLTRHSLASL
jgi:TPR repeat protein